MGLGSNHTGVVVAANFIPEIWSDEVIASYKKKLVLGNLVTNINFKGKPKSEEHLSSAWPEATRARLREIRQKYDPDAVFPGH